jgi:sensor histidine kinase YesM
VSNLATALEDAPERLLSRGVGLANTRARLEQLYGARQSFEIRNLQPRGVVVSISVPLRPAAAGKYGLVGEAAR